MAKRGDDIILVSERRLVIGRLSSSSGTGQTEHTSGASQCKSDAPGFSRVAGGASAQTESQEASERGGQEGGGAEGVRRSNCKCQK